MKASTTKLRFNKANDQAKLSRIAEWYGCQVCVYNFSLPSGHACPFADECLSKADRYDGHITDGPNTTFRCFAASDEARQPSVRQQRWYNFQLLRQCRTKAEMVALILESLPARFDIMRVHIGGDFYNQMYFEAWLEVARLKPGQTFYAYTKSIPYWIANIGNIPDNFVLNASRGGRMDAMIDLADLKVAEVVFSLDEADTKGLEIDHDERHAILPTGNFALLIHGTQPKGSTAAAAKRELSRNGVEHSYSRK